MVLKWRSLLPWGIVAALLVALVLTCGDESPEPILSDETKAAIERDSVDAEAYRGLRDSLARAAAAEDSASQATSDSLRNKASASADTSVLREERSRDLHKSANQHAEAADKARAAVVSASSREEAFTFMQVAYEERTHEVEAVRRAYDTLGGALLLARRATQLEKERADSAEVSKKRAVDIEKERTALAEQRVEDLEALQARILADVSKAEKGCRILGLVRCPTRKEAFIVGTIVGAGGAVVATVALR